MANAEDTSFMMGVVSFDRTEKIYVKASSVIETVNLIKEKLKLSSILSYRLFQEDTGFVIDSDEILLELCKDKSRLTPPEKLSVMLVPQNSKWPDPLQVTIVLQNNEDCIMPDSVSDVGRTDDGSSLPNSLSVRSTSGSSNVAVANLSFPVPAQANNEKDKSFPWPSINRTMDSFLEYLKASSETPDFVEIGRRKAIVISDVLGSCGNFIIHTLDDYRRKTAEQIAQKVVLSQNGKYLKIFGTYYANTLLDDGVKSFHQKLYRYLQVRKPDEKKNPHLIGRPDRRKRRTADEIRREEEEQDFGLHPPSNQDEYGCINYEVKLPDNETEATQERSREKILALTDYYDGEAAALMSATYYLQRQDLIYKLKPAVQKLPGIINRWPLLAQEDFLVSHAKVLLGKDVSKVWQNNISAKASSLFGFMAHYFSDLGECKQKALCKKMTDIINKARELNASTRSEVATYSAIFPLIVGFMKNKENQLFNFMPKLSTDEEVREEAKRVSKGFPILVIRGDSIFDTDLILNVVVVNQILIKVKNLHEGLLTHLLTYFVFNTVYQPSLHSTLEFFQRFILEVNPPRGSKRPKAKRIVGEIDKDVKRLQKKLEAYDARKWVLPSDAE